MHFLTKTTATPLPNHIMNEVCHRKEIETSTGDCTGLHLHVCKMPITAQENKAEENACVVCVFQAVS
jgi:hypothetical protein